MEQVGTDDEGLLGAWRQGWRRDLYAAVRAPMYQAASGNVYADEGSHWDVTFYSCGC